MIQVNGERPVMDRALELKQLKIDLAIAMAKVVFGYGLAFFISYRIGEMIREAVQ